jgi:hypothetical protein
VRIALMDQNCFAEEKGTETMLSLLTVDRGRSVQSRVIRELLDPS